jgi:two-component sensor histidine kinase
LWDGPCGRRGEQVSFMFAPERGTLRVGQKGSAAVQTGDLQGRSPELNRSLVKALRHTGISLIYQDLSLNVVWAQNVPPVWSERDLTGLSDEEFLPDGEAIRVTAVKQTVCQSGDPQSLEISVQNGANVNWYELSVDADKDAKGAVIGIITTAIDVTDRRRREQTLRALLREVSHRSKNLLAIIQSIASQTGRYSGTIDSFLLRFRGRLQSLASSQDLVTSSNWRGADLRELVIGQVGRYVVDPTRHLLIEGANPYLNPNAALHIGLALHELAVNSVSYGALAKANGYVTISAETGSEHELTLVWREALTAAARDAGEKRFGSVALERVVPAALNAAATLTIGETGLEYRLTIPAGSLATE